MVLARLGPFEFNPIFILLPSVACCRFRIVREKRR
jgi:hypothetical protein